ncbi:S-layer homology domain-containing protein [Patescibacteria group bacterium]
MKKLIMLVLVLSALFVAQTALATDVCSNEPRQSADFYVENHRVNWLLSMSCLDSEILTTMPVGSVMHVIGKTEGWHKLETENGLVGWMWEDYVQPTTKPFNPGGSEPEPEPQPEPEPVEYVAMRDISGHKYEEAIWYVYNNDIVQGYEDGSYKPDQKINRAELLKIIVESAFAEKYGDYVATSSGASDVYSDAWYYKYVSFGNSFDIVEGYTDGSFRPANNINFVEALKIVMIGMGYEYEVGDPWFKNLVDLASENNFIPLDIDKFDDQLTRGQVAEMITRIKKYQAEELDEYLGTMADARITYEMLES